MDVKKLLDTIHLVEKLKDVERHCYTSGGRRESVAEHCWRTAVMAFFIKDEFPEADIDKVIRMCLVHDLGEIFTGDIPVFIKTEEDGKKEETLLYGWVDELPEPYRTELRELFEEMEERTTVESKIYKALDSLEAVIQHNESDISTWEENEYELNRTYAYDRTEFSAYLMELRKAIRDETEIKIENGGKNEQR